MHPRIFQIAVLLALWQIMKAVCVPKRELLWWQNWVNGAFKAGPDNEMQIK